jgi:GTP-binding protein YchF
MALQVGIVGLPNSGKTTLFTALTGTGTQAVGKENVGMAAIPDARLTQLADVIQAKKVTPAAIRVVDVPGTGAQLLGNLRQVDLLLLVLDAWSGTRKPQDDYETVVLELLAADREHVERRLERVSKQAKSGDAKLRAEVENLRRLAAHLENLQAVSELGADVDLPAELELLTIKPLLRVVNGSGAGSIGGKAADARPENRVASGALEGIDLKLEAELAELPEEEARAFREGESALAEVVRALAEELDLITFFTAGEKETRAWTLRRGSTALDAAETVHSDIARGFIRAEVIRWDDLVASGSHTEAARAGMQRLEGKTYVVQDGDVLNVRFNV